MEKSELEKLIAGGVNEILPDESVIWKPLRRMLDEGHPTDPATILACSLADGLHYPFCALAKSAGNRLIFWPPSNAAVSGGFADGSEFAVHHVTQELSTETSHLTRFKPGGSRDHINRSWKLRQVAPGVRLWLMGAFRVEELKRQAGALEQEIKMPTKDVERRKAEFVKYMGGLQHVDVATPKLRGDCLVSAFYLLSESPPFGSTIEPSYFPMGSFWHEIVDGWPEGDQFEIAPTRLEVFVQLE